VSFSVFRLLLLLLLHTFFPWHSFLLCKFLPNLIFPSWSSSWMFFCHLHGQDLPLNSFFIHSVNMPIPSHLILFLILFLILSLLFFFFYTSWKSHLLPLICQYLHSPTSRFVLYTII
jgi:hypothetical protein